MSGDPDSIPAAAPPLTAYTCSPGGRMDKCKKSANSFHPRHAFCTLFNTFRGGNFYFPVCFVHTARWSGIINILKCISLYKQKINLFEVKIDNSQSQTNKDRMQMSNVPCTVYFPRQRFSHSLVGDLTPDNSCCQTTAQFAVIVCLLLIITVNVVIMLSRAGPGDWGKWGLLCAVQEN